MYKKQMTFQRIVCLAMLIACVVVFVYSLGLVTDLHDSLRNTIRDHENLDNSSVTGSRVYFDMQPFNRSFTLYSIILLLLNLLLFVMGTNSRRKYYIGNYVSIAIASIGNIAMTVWALPQILAFKQQFLNINFEELKAFSERRNSLYTESTFWFDIGFGVFGLLMLVTVLLIINMILKIIVMKEEKRLIGSRKDVRA